MRVVEWLLNVVGRIYGTIFWTAILDLTVWDSMQRVGVGPYIGRLPLCFSRLRDREGKVFYSY